MAISCRYHTMPLINLPNLALFDLVIYFDELPVVSFNSNGQRAGIALIFHRFPVGVLSQAYECYLSKHDKDSQRREGGYYTPRHIAELMVGAAFRTIASDADACLARVLDPAAGAGVFLLTAFRHLVAERWRRDGHRPETSTLRSILYEQITGFDINESALRFAALGLYLISIELDPHPEPLQKLAFTNFRGTVLHKFTTVHKSGASDQK